VTAGCVAAFFAAITGAVNVQASEAMLTTRIILLVFIADLPGRGSAATLPL
jgi:hypothetical protein